MALQADDRERRLQVVPIDELKVDHRYQRLLNQNLVEEIHAAWDMVAADVITVSRRDTGELYIVNGQHRAAAAKLAGETEMLAFVYEGLTVEQEADLRLKSNTQRPDTSLERFWASVTRGDKRARAIVALLEEFETKVNRSPNNANGVNCVSTLEMLYTDSEQLLRGTLRAIKEAHGTINGEPARVPVIRGVFWFLKVHEGDYHWSSLIDRMAKHGPDDLMRRARSHKVVAGGPDWINYYRALLEVYNYRRAEHTRLEARTKFSSRLENRWLPPSQPPKDEAA
jgi:hypothetical protein